MPLNIESFNLNSLNLESLQNINPLLILASSAVVVPCLYILTSGVAKKSTPKITNKRICLLIAHPDDEAMFFAPTVLGLTQPDTGNHVKILCLSAGNAVGLGETRKKELVKSGLALGLKHKDDVFVVDTPDSLTYTASRDFPDSMTTKWDENKICNLLCSAFAPQLSQQRARDVAQPTANIDVLITFDSQGVSSHPNHISLYHGARAFNATLTKGKPNWKSPIDLYTLGSVNVLRKYSGCLDIFATLAVWLGVRHEDSSKPGGLIFTNQLVGTGPRLSTAWGAMTQAHRSQMVWFRYLWLGFSRYMLINDLRLEKVDEGQ
ncbi:N-acetylglucosaminyl-phosphatidylinositol de-N-acetylase [Cladobotryum mycophilum]|uniref:N-acetylglucosaminylphosphatidylinositol deacetylase n=1 Tax=Cladobotryum mycophilum TaxID=491253 RepID=A0ABR0SQR7_9HYPO